MKLVNEEQRNQLKAFVDKTEQMLQGLESLKEPRDPDLREDNLLPEKKIYQVVDGKAKKLKHAARQFDSDILVAVSMGILKAGKSTLTNLLARHECASPTGFGVDTTLRPALIRSMPKDAMTTEAMRNGRICVYYSNDSQSFGNDLFLLMNELRGMGDSRLRRKEYPLNNQNLREVLCKESVPGGEPLLVVVETPYREDARMLQDGRMLLDMPGLDSGRADEWLKNGNGYEGIIRECDVVLFVQSSVAPLNKKAGEYLEKIFTVRPTATAWMIQNRMLTKPWVKQEVLEREVEEQEKKAREALSHAISGSKCPLRVISANLGMAYDRVFLKDEDFSPINDIQAKEYLWGRSNYPALEDELFEEMRDNGAKKRFEYCRSRFVDEIIGIRNDLDARISETAKIKEECESKLRIWKQFLDDVNEQLHINREFVCSRVRDVSTTLSIPSDKIYRETEGGTDGMNCDEIKGSVIDGYLDTCRQKIARWISDSLKNELCLNDVLFGKDTLVHVCNEIISDTFGKAERKLMEEAPKVLGNLYNKIRSRMGYSYKGAHHISIDAVIALPVSYVRYENYRRTWYLLKKEVVYQRDERVWARDAHGKIKASAEEALSSALREKIGDVLCELVCIGVAEGSKAYIGEINREIAKWQEQYDRCTETNKRLWEIKEYLETNISTFKKLAHA